MNKLYITLSCAFVICFLNACYDDEGNYDYFDNNRVSSIDNIEEEYTVYRNKTLLIEPKIILENSNSADYSYEWKLEWFNSKKKLRDTIISTEQTLNFTPDSKIVAIQYNCVYTVTDINTKVEEPFEFNIKVDSEVAFGEFILHYNDNQAQVAILKDNGTIFEKFYQNEIGVTLLGEPLFLSGFYKRIGVFTNHPDMKGYFIDKDSYVIKTKVEEHFYEFPNDGVIKHFEQRDGQYYVLMESGEFMHDNGYQQSEIMPFVDPKSAHSINMDYLDPYHTVLHDSNGQFWAIGRFSGVTKRKHGSVDLNLEGEVLYYFGVDDHYNDYNTLDVRVLMRHDNGLIKEYVVKHSYGSDVLENENVDEFVGADLIESNSKFIRSYTEPYYYFSSGSKIYRYNHLTSSMPTVYYTLPEGSVVSYLNMDFSETYNPDDYNYHAADKAIQIGFYNPNSTVDNGSYHKIDIRTGNVEIEENNKFGVIRDIIIK